MATKVCNKCKKTFQLAVGRPPRLCWECRGVEAPPIKKASQEKVLHLETNLKAKGLHISQHRKDYE